ncbi:MAG: DUF2272 domain-containing protein [Acidobacteria bacterium]|nr:MAG: DUF2272 domain-containing protein [Acidobacteriota bacterium]
MPHIVKSGETINGIAQALGITPQQLLDANPIFKSHPDVIHPGDVLVIPGEETAGPPPAPSAPTTFTSRLAAIARDLHTRFHTIIESDPRLCGEIKQWTEDIGADFVSCTREPWSAVFVSWCVKRAGATADEFKFSKSHSVFVHKAIQNADSGTGVFRGREITAHAPKVGDIIQNNRNGATITFDFARHHEFYTSHSVIVVEIAHGPDGPIARCIGGNEGDSVRESQVPLTPHGFIRQRGHNPFICVIETLK